MHENKPENEGPSRNDMDPPDLELLGKVLHVRPHLGITFSGDGHPPLTQIALALLSPIYISLLDVDHIFRKKENDLKNKRETKPLGR